MSYQMLARGEMGYVILEDHVFQRARESGENPSATTWLYDQSNVAPSNGDFPNDSNDPHFWLVEMAFPWEFEILDSVGLVLIEGRMTDITLCEDEAARSPLTWVQSQKGYETADALRYLEAGCKTWKIL